MHPSAPAWLSASFVALAVTMAALFALALARVRPAWRTRVLLAVVAWLALTAVPALAGVLLRFDARPPPFVLLLVFVLAASIGLALSRVGAALAELPLWLLVLAQGFRLPLELVMHEAARAGVMPSVMSFGVTTGGRNVDIVAGALALVVGAALQRGAPRWLAGAWVALAFATLVNVLFVAMRATPLVRAYGDDQLNTWVAYWPFIWLPTVLVVSALVGQLVVVRALTPNRRRTG